MKTETVNYRLLIDLVLEHWWIGFQVTDADVWEKVKDGTYSMFSIEGKAERVEVNNE